MLIKYLLERSDVMSAWVSVRVALTEGVRPKCGMICTLPGEVSLATLTSLSVQHMWLVARTRYQGRRKDISLRHRVGKRRRHQTGCEHADLNIRFEVFGKDVSLANGIVRLPPSVFIFCIEGIGTSRAVGKSEKVVM